MATSFWDRLLGLLNPNNPRTLIFRTRFGLHTFGLADPIDILVLDNHQRVAKVGIEVMPNRFFFYNPFHSVVIELPAGVLNSSGTGINDKIIIA